MIGLGHGEDLRRNDELQHDALCLIPVLDHETSDALEFFDIAPCHTNYAGFL